MGETVRAYGDPERKAAWEIHPSLEHLAVSIDSLVPWPDNPRRGDVDMIRESLWVFGQLKPVVVQQSTGYLCAGNHLWRTACEEGWKQVAAVVVDLTDDQARRFLLMDNKSSDAGGYDNLALSEMLDQLARSDQGLWSTGYTDQELSDLLSDLADDYDPDGADPVPGEGAGGPAGPTMWDLVVSCSTEPMRDRLLRRFTGEGLDVRAM